ncbi:MAG: Bro-N domain-containing protein [Selenomonadaceae bacterium]|nr:Bro-N domain-containing protein [Selenomonadaceae bacterium]
MNYMEIFKNSEFGSVRTTIIDNQPYFVGKDVADILGYKNSRQAIRDHVDEDDKGVTKWFQQNDENDTIKRGFSEWVHF